MTSDSWSSRLEQRQEGAKVGSQTETRTLSGSAHIKGAITITIDIRGCKVQCNAVGVVKGGTRGAQAPRIFRAMKTSAFLTSEQ